MGATATAAPSFAKASEAARRESNVTLHLSFLRNFPSSEASHESLFAVVLEMILFSTGIDAHILSLVRVMFSECSLVMSCSMSNNWSPIPI